MQPIIEAKGVSFSYQEQKVLEGVDFNLHQGDVLSLLGPNGTGKSTFMKILLGLYKSSGAVRLYGKDIQTYSHKEIAKHISYVPQTHKIPFAYSVFDVVLMGRLPHLGLFEHYSDEDKKIALDALREVGIEHLSERNYSKISGGERQLTLIARSIAQGVKILFMDEPVTGLDYGNQIKLLQLMRSFADKGYTFLVTTHYPDHALYASNKVVMLNGGGVVAHDEVAKVMTPANIKNLYGVDVMIKEEGEYKYCIPTM